MSSDRPPPSETPKARITRLQAQLAAKQDEVRTAQKALEELQRTEAELASQLKTTIETHRKEAIAFLVITISDASTDNVFFEGAHTEPELFGKKLYLKADPHTRQASVQHLHMGEIYIRVNPGRPITFDVPEGPNGETITYNIQAYATMEEGLLNYNQELKIARVAAPTPSPTSS
jgi:hypothetical protein